MVGEAEQRSRGARPLRARSTRTSCCSTCACPGMDGIEAARHLDALDDPPAVIFTTAYDEYALEAFETQAVGYLLKPVRKEKLARALRHAARVAGQQLARLAEQAQLGRRRAQICARLGEQLRLIPIEDICYFAADQKYVTVRHAGGSDLIDESLRALAARVRARLRAHPSQFAGRARGTCARSSARLRATTSCAAGVRRDAARQPPSRGRGAAADSRRTRVMNDAWRPTRPPMPARPVRLVGPAFYVRVGRCCADRRAARTSSAGSCSRCGNRWCGPRCSARCSRPSTRGCQRGSATGRESPAPSHRADACCCSCCRWRPSPARSPHRPRNCCSRLDASGRAPGPTSRPAAISRGSRGRCAWIGAHTRLSLDADAGMVVAGREADAAGRHGLGRHRSCSAHSARS